MCVVFHTVQYSLISPPTLGFLLLAKTLGNGEYRRHADFLRDLQREKLKAFCLVSEGKRGKIFVLRVCNTEVLPQLGSQAVLDVPVMADAS